MTTTAGQPASTANEEVAGYLAEVASHLGRLDPAERAELLDDLEQHLVEVAAEPGPPLHDRLGSPAAYAAELLASVGVDPDDGPQPTPRRLWAAVAKNLQLLAASERAADARRFVRDLYPAWLLARGVLLAALIAVPLLKDDNAPVAFLCIVGGVALSLALARRRTEGWRRVGILVSTVVALMSVPLIAEAIDSIGRSNPVYYDSQPHYATASQCLTNRRGQAIQNLFPYDKTGQPLQGVLLYDQTGQPVDNLCPEQQDHNGNPVTTTYARDVNGNMVVNTFPRAQTRVDAQFGTTTPIPPPAIVIPRLAEPATTTTTTAPPTTTSAPPTTTSAPPTTTSAPPTTTTTTTAG